ncbi:hypothetical protein [Kozakia baliensis]|uniref:hypothetical protein n=1 Tax=Kozakia baliensis TaxID=153496 RepID=UPI00087C80FF|nr:hypothetical protein [Kozakia baliensis]AOX20023.1 hypothetical protein A0U90_06650 [Kozakia baliensis]
MALFPGWRVPDFPLVTPSGQTTFRSWTAGTWSVFLPRVQDFSTPSILSGAAAIMERLPYFVRVVGILPPAAQSASEAIIAEGNGINTQTNSVTLLQDIDGQALAKWRGPELEISDDSSRNDRVIYLLAPNGTIRFALNYSAEERPDFLQFVETLICLMPTSARRLAFAA